MRKFSCVDNCGECCKNLRGRFDKSVASSYASHAKHLSRTTGIFFLTYPSRLTIFILDWEARPLRRKARSLGIELRLSPHMVARDRNSGRILVFGWNLDHDDCPFLDESSRCRVYDFRPLHCRGFPISFGPSREVERVTILGFGWCPAIVPLNGLGKTTTPREVDKIYLGCAMASIALRNFILTMRDMYLECVSGLSFAPTLGRSSRFIKREATDRRNLVGFVDWISEQTGESVSIVEETLRMAAR